MQGQKSRKKSLGEMEAEFLDAMASFYYDGKPIMSNEEFDNLKVRFGVPNARKTFRGSHRWQCA